MTVGSLALCGAWYLKYAEVGAPEQGEEQEGFVPHCRQDSIQFLLFFLGGGKVPTPFMEMKREA